MGFGTLPQPSEQEIRLRRLGIVVAMTAEARSLVQKPILRGDLIHLSEGIAIQLSGMGPRKAREAGKNLLGHGATALLSWGSAGGLIPTLSPGDLVLPGKVIGSDQSCYSTDPTWRGRLYGRLIGSLDLRQGSLAESVTALKSPAEKRVLFERTGAIAVDMESRAVAEVAQEAGVPFMAVRAIADPADTTIPQSPLRAVDEFGELSLLTLLSGLIGHPAQLFNLVRLGWNFRAAHVTLSKVARMAGSHLLIPE
jgi:adenosylhomocysteine nucleosidase